MRPKGISSPSAPPAVGPYSQAVRAGDFVFLSGLIALDPATSKLIDGGISEQADRCFKNLSNILKSADAQLADVVQFNVYLASLEDWPVMNEACKKFFVADPAPARTSVFPAILPPGARILMDAVAYKPVSE